MNGEEEEERGENGVEGRGRRRHSRRMIEDEAE